MEMEMDMKEYVRCAIYGKSKLLLQTHKNVNFIAYWCVLRSDQFISILADVYIEDSTQMIHTYSNIYTYHGFKQAIKNNAIYMHNKYLNVPIRDIGNTIKQCIDINKIFTEKGDIIVEELKAEYPNKSLIEWVDTAKIHIKALEKEYVEKLIFDKKYELVVYSKTFCVARTSTHVKVACNRDYNTYINKILTYDEFIQHFLSEKKEGEILRSMDMYDIQTILDKGMIGEFYIGSSDNNNAAEKMNSKKWAINILRLAPKEW